MAHAFVFKKSNAPAIAVVAGVPGALGKTTES
jgi:hypothetical protein